MLNYFCHACSLTLYLRLYDSSLLLVLNTRLCSPTLTCTVTFVLKFYTYMYISWSTAIYVLRATICPNLTIAIPPILLSLRLAKSANLFTYIISTCPSILPFRTLISTHLCCYNPSVKLTGTVTSTVW